MRAEGRRLFVNDVNVSEISRLKKTLFWRTTAQLQTTRTDNMHHAIEGVSQHSQSFELLWLELTNVCNLSCVHCYADSGPSTQSHDCLDESEYLRVISDARKAGCKKIQFIGGEPTLNTSLPKYLAAASDLKFKYIEVFSNLNRLSPLISSAIIRSGAAVATSFYSYDPDTHDSITRRKGSFKSTLSNIQRLSNCGVPLRAGFIEMEENAGHFDQTKSLLQSVGVRRVNFDRIRAIGRGKAKSVSQSLCGHCSKGSLCVSSTGAVFPCIMSREWEVGSVKTATLSSIAYSDELTHARKLLDSKFAEGAPDYNSCNPEDKCHPGACGPQVDAPDDCDPREMCTPEIFDDEKDQSY